MMPINTSYVLWCCILSSVCATRNASLAEIIVNGEDVELAGRGLLDLKNIEDVEALLGATYDMCDYYNTCNTSVDVPEHFLRLQQCCIPCDCSDRCFDMVNCCRDKVGGTRHSSTGDMISEDGETCTTVEDRGVENDIPQSYLLVTHCHPDYQGEARDLCKIPYGTTLEQLTPVYSDQTGLTYSNIYCARCNYQTTPFTAWAISVECPSYTPIHAFEDINPLLQHGCTLTWLPDVHATSCYKRNGPEICENKLFPNLCKSVPEGNDFVTRLTLYACLNCGLTLENFWVCDQYIQGEENSYSAFLAWNSNAMAENVDPEPEICQEGEQYDDSEQTCLRMTCAPSQLSIKTEENTCLTFMTQVKGVCLDFRLSVSISTPVLKYNNNAKLVMTKAVNDFFHEQSQYVPWNIDVIGRKLTEGSLTYNIQVIEIWDESYCNVQNRFLEFENYLQNTTNPDGIQIQKDKTSRTGLRSLPLDEIGFLSFEDYLNPQTCEKTIAVSDLQFCEMVTFLPNEYTIQNENLVLKGGMKFLLDEYVVRDSVNGSKHVQLCLHSYLANRGIVAPSSATPVASNTCFSLIWNLVLMCVLIR